MEDNDVIVKRFFELRNLYWESKDMKSFLFLKHILVYFYECRNVFDDGCFSRKFLIPGHWDLIKADSVLSALGYRKYSINHMNNSDGKPVTQIIFRNTL